MNNIVIENLDNYYQFVSELKPNRTVQVKTNKGLYKLITREKVEVEILNETEKELNPEGKLKKVVELLIHEPVDFIEQLELILKSIYKIV